MLRQILAEFQKAQQPLCLDELSQKLAIEPSALDGMLQTLVQRGRLLEIDPAHQGCVACPTRGGCIILTNGLQKTYILPPGQLSNLIKANTYLLGSRGEAKTV